MTATARGRPAATDTDSYDPEACSGRRTCIVVLGMHRSGTSALTRVVNLLGAALPDRILGASPGNRAGHWEPAALVQFHEALLAELGSTWHDWTALDLSRLSADRRAEIMSRIAAIIAHEYGPAPLLVVKDPRICRFASLFLEALTTAGITPECILLFRNPLEVAQSLKCRDGMPSGQAGLLWLRHVLDAEAASRGHRRIIASYDAFLADWRREIGRLDALAAADHAHSDAAAQGIARFLDPAHRHHTQSDAAMAGDPFMCGWIADVHAALQRLRRDPDCGAALATLDRVRHEFESAGPAITRVHRDLCSQINRLARQRELLDAEASSAGRPGVAREGANSESVNMHDVTTQDVKMQSVNSDGATGHDVTRPRDIAPAPAPRAAVAKPAARRPAPLRRLLAWIGPGAAGDGPSLQELAERYYGSDANRKPPVYLDEYQRLFAPMRRRRIRILELGVRFGASMLIWRDYFPSATIVGLDIDERPKAVPPDKRLHFVQGSQDDPTALQRCTAAAGGPFDVIIDDAAHLGALSGASFHHLFPHALKPDGLYIIEDICTAFLPEFPDSETFVAQPAGHRLDTRRFGSHQAGMVGVVKQLFDHVMAPVAQGRPSAYGIKNMLVLPNIVIMQKSA